MTTKALVAVSHTTLGGIYYTANLTVTGAQPSWNRLTTTGLPAVLTPDIMRIDYNDPINVQYLGFDLYGFGGPGAEIYARNGGNWTKVMDLATAATVTANPVTSLNSLWTDPTAAAGVVYTTAVKEISIISYVNYILKSTDYGATWAVQATVSRNNFFAYLQVIGNYMWVAAPSSISTAVGGSLDGGATWGYAGVTLGLWWPSITIDENNPSRCYGETPGDNVDLFTIAAPATVTKADTGFGGDNGQRVDQMWTDPNNAGYACNLVDEHLWYTTDGWTTDTDVTLTIGEEELAALSGVQVTGSPALVFGTKLDSSRIYYLSDKTDTTPVNRSGSNSGSAPYTNSIPDVGVIPTWGIWAGEGIADDGIYLYSVEEGDITNIPDADNLGLPLFGDRSSWRDYDADDDGDGTELSRYHAQDIRDDMPQRHNPWPASSGQAPVSDGSKYIATDIITQAEFDYSFYIGTHCPVTLDADAALILDLQGGCTPAQEIGLDVQQPTYVFIGPSFMPPDEPTFRPMYIEELANVTTTAPVLDGEVLTFDGATGEWVNEGTNRRRTVTTLTAGTYTIDDTYDVVVLDATAGDIEVTLPETDLNDGLEYAFKRIDDTANEVAIRVLDYILLDSDGETLTDSDGEILTDSDSAAGDTIDGELVQYLDSQYLAIQIVADADNSAWWII